MIDEREVREAVRGALALAATPAEGAERVLAVLKPFFEASQADLRRALTALETMEGGLAVTLTAPASTPAGFSLEITGELWMERMRQALEEGFMPDDDIGRCEDLGLAASAYCYSAGLRGELREWVMPGKPVRPPWGAFVAATLRVLWPWDFAWWKPTAGEDGRRRDLVKAGALVIAAIEAFDRGAAVAARDRREALAARERADAAQMTGL